jgi:hypothetical protein
MQRHHGLARARSAADEHQLAGMQSAGQRGVERFEAGRDRQQLARLSHANRLIEVTEDLRHRAWRRACAASDLRHALPPVLVLGPETPA